MVTMATTSSRKVHLKHLLNIFKLSLFHLELECVCSQICFDCLYIFVFIGMVQTGRWCMERNDPTCTGMSQTMCMTVGTMYDFQPLGVQQSQSSWCWRADIGHQTPDTRHWTPDNRHWTIDTGHQTLDTRHQTEQELKIEPSLVVETQQ